MLDKVYWLRKSCTRDIVAIVSNNLLFTSLLISDESKFVRFKKVGNFLKKAPLFLLLNPVVFCVESTYKKCLREE